MIQLYAEFARPASGSREYELQLNSIGDASLPAGVRRAPRPRGSTQHDDVLDEDARAQAARRTRCSVFDVKNPAVREALEDAPKIGESLCAECEAHFAGVRALLDAYGVAYTLEPTLVRGLDYYTRTVFEFVGPEEKAQLGDLLRRPLRRPRRGDRRPADAGDRLRRRHRARSCSRSSEEGAATEAQPIDVFFAADGATARAGARDDGRAAPARTSPATPTTPAAR